MKKTNRRTLAGILALLFGSLGLHKFYLGYNTAGLIMLGATIFCAATGHGTGLVGLVGLIEAIIYFSKSDDEFERIYVYGKREWL